MILRIKNKKNIRIKQKKRKYNSKFFKSHYSFKIKSNTFIKKNIICRKKQFLHLIFLLKQKKIKRFIRFSWKKKKKIPTGVKFFSIFFCWLILFKLQKRYRQINKKSIYLCVKKIKNTLNYNIFSFLKGLRFKHFFLVHKNTNKKKCIKILHNKKPILIKKVMRLKIKKNKKILNKKKCFFILWKKKGFFKSFLLRFYWIPLYTKKKEQIVFNFLHNFKIDNLYLAASKLILKKKTKNRIYLKKKNYKKSTSIIQIFGQTYLQQKTLRLKHISLKKLYKKQNNKHLRKQKVYKKKKNKFKIFKIKKKKLYANTWEYNNKFINVFEKNENVEHHHKLFFSKKKRVFWKKKKSIYKRIITLNNLFHYYKQEKKYFLFYKENKMDCQKNVQKLSLYKAQQHIQIKPVASELKRTQRFHLFLLTFIIKTYLSFFIWVKYMYKKINVKYTCRYNNFFSIKFLFVEKKPYSSFFLWTNLSLINRNLLLRSKRRARYIKKMHKLVLKRINKKLYNKRFFYLLRICRKKFFFKLLVKTCFRHTKKKKKYVLHNLILRTFTKRIVETLLVRKIKELSFYLYFFFKTQLTYKKRFLIKNLFKFIKNTKLYLKKKQRRKKKKNFFYTYLSKFQRILYKATFLKYTIFLNYTILSKIFFMLFKCHIAKKQLKFVLKKIRHKKIKSLSKKMCIFLNNYLHMHNKGLYAIAIQRKIHFTHHKLLKRTPLLFSCIIKKNSYTNLLFKNNCYKQILYIFTLLIKAYRTKHFKNIFCASQIFWSIFLKKFNTYNSVLLKKYTNFKSLKNFVFSHKLLMILIIQMQQLLTHYFSSQLFDLTLELNYLLHKVNKNEMHLCSLYANNALKNKYFFFKLWNKQKNC